jgi:glycine hydroxymethyltransferase
MIIAGASSYPRLIDYKKIIDIATHADFITFSSYKTIMGGHGGSILAREEYGEKVNHAVYPGGQGTSGVNLTAAKALIFKLAESEEFIAIQQRTLDNAALMASFLNEKGYRQ